MQNRNFFKVFAIVFSIVCLYQLSFTWVADSIESDADDYATNFSPEEYSDKYRFYLDSVSGEKVYDILIAEYTLFRMQAKRNQPWIRLERWYECYFRSHGS